VFIFEKAPFPSCHASTIVEVEAGRLLAAWFGGTDEGKKDVKIWLARFDGKTWTRPEVAAQEPGYPCWNPVLFRSAAKTTFLFYKAGPSPMSWSGYLRRSGDGGKSWGQPEQLPAGLLGPIKNKPIQLASGAILAGTSVESHRAWAGWVERSRDNGKTWRRFGPIAVPGRPHGLIQPTLFETNARAIVALCRSRGIGFICQAESKDDGETWTPARPTKLPNPNSGIDAVRTRAGSVFLVYNHSRLARHPLSVARSDDVGKTWTTVATLEDQAGEYSYPAIIQGQDGRLHITYTWNRTHIKHVALDPEKLLSQ
jgi:predicted neuraminidase